MNDAPILEVRNIAKQYPGVRALDGVDFDVRAGEVHVLLGPNGAGKSTLIKCVSGVVAPTEGEILVGGEPLPTGEPSESMARGVGTIYQELDLVDDLTVAECVFLGHEIGRGGLMDRAAMRRETAELLERLDHSNISPTARVRTLRPASQQIVSIARALSRKIRLLIMDEPSAILDDHEIETLFGVVRRLTEQGVGVIYISHRLDEVRRIGDRVTVLSDGRTVAVGLPPDTSHGQARGAHGRPQGGTAISRAPEAHRRRAARGARCRAPSEIKPASLEVHAGEIVGIGGLVGAGRTELLRLIYGLDSADDGEVVVDGKRLPGGKPAAAIAAGLGLAPEDRKSQGLLLAWSLANNVTLADLGKYRRRGLLSPRAERKAAGELLRELKTKPDNPRALASELSGGNQQKVVLARWLMRQCKVMLFDEPTRGVDVGAKAEIYRLITDLSKAGKGLLVVSSEMPELIGLCTRILVMREGELVADVPGDEATEFELLRHAVTHPESVPEEIK